MTTVGGRLLREAAVPGDTRISDTNCGRVTGAESMARKEKGSTGAQREGQHLLCRQVSGFIVLVEEVYDWQGDDVAVFKS